MIPGQRLVRPTPGIIELDFDMGNIRSLQKAFEYLGCTVDIQRVPDKIREADALIIPGDGAFGQAMENIKAIGFYDAILDFIKTGKPVLGICIGFQILFQNSEEFDYKGNGLSVFQGSIEKFKSENLIIPHMGWNQVVWQRKSRISANIPDKSYFYFVHSYRCAQVHAYATGITQYDGEFTSVIENENIFGVQFHPEKSYRAGLKLLENFIGII